MSSPDLGAGLLASMPASGPCRFGAGRSASSAGFGGPGIFGIAGVGIDIGRGPAGFGIVPVVLWAGFAACAGRITRDLQLEHVTNFAPTGTSASAMRLTVPQAEQVASIIRRI
jgi:hypothetical protein